jgi:AsmA protein
MRKFLSVIVALLVLTLIAVGALLLFPPVGLFQDRLVSALGQAIGYRVTTGGKLTLSFIPRMLVRLEDVALANIAEKEATPFLHAREIKAEADWRPLLSRTLLIRRLTISEPHFVLAIDKEGRKSWSMAERKVPPPAVAGAATVRLGEVHLEGGDLAYTDARSGARVQLEQINAETKQFSFDAPFTTVFDFVWMKEKVEGSGTLQVPATTGVAIPSGLVLSSRHGKLEFKGDVAAADAALKGRVNGSGPSLRELASWLGRDLPNANGFGKFEFEANMLAQAGLVDLTNLRLSLDGSTADGGVKLDLAATRPMLSGGLSLDRLDTARYMGHANQARSTAPVLESTSGTGVEVELLPVKQSLAAYLQGDASQSAYETNATVREAGWSDDPVDVSALKSAKVDVDVNIKVNQLQHGSIAFGRADVMTRLSEGRLDLEVKELAAHGGTLSGAVNLDMRSSLPTLEATINMDGVNAEQLLADFGARAYITGKATGQAKLKGAGVSERAMVGSLTGTVQAHANSGSIHGYDVRRMITHFWEQQTFDLTNRTPFERVQANLNIDTGVARSSTVELTGSSVGIKGEGMLRLLTRQLDYRTNISLPPPDNFLVSVRIFGSWLKSQVAVDWDSFFKNWTRTLTSEGAVVETGIADPELDALVKRAIEKQGPGRELDPQGAAILKALTGAQ